ncbi:uncharacterized protein LOC144606861 [Rhinoraja longicauda]
MVVRANKIQHLIGFFLLCIAIFCNVQSSEDNSTMSYANMTMDNMTMDNMTMDNMTSTESYENMTVTKMEPPENFSCQAFNCMGASCYENQMKWEECPWTHMYCEFYTVSNSSYWAACSNSCAGTENICMNSTDTMCTMECCNSTLCLMLNGTIQEIPDDYEMTEPMTEMTDTTMEPTPTTAATTRGSDYMCAVISCAGDTCYQSQGPQLEYCAADEQYCKLEKETSSSQWTGGCDADCNTISSGCSSNGDAQTCVQECCEANTESSCLTLDGQEYLMASASMTQSMKVIVYAIAMFALANHFALFRF